MSQILIIGTGHSETYTDQETGKRHTRIGGPAGITAQELHRAGHQPLLHVSMGPDQTGRNTAAIMNNAGIWWEHSSTQARSSFADITLKDGQHQRTSGNFPILTNRDLDIVHLVTLTETFPWVIIDSNVAPTVARLIGALAQNIIMLSSAKSRIHNLLKVGPNVPKRLVTCNEAEARIATGSTKFKLSDLQQRFNAEAMMVTFGHRGWAYRDANQAFHAPAPTAPPHCDFIGAGDSATAGAVHALITGEPVQETVNGFIARRLDYTASLRDLDD